MSAVVIIGTAKGAFVLRPDATRAHWSIEGPLFRGWKVTASSRSQDGTYFLGTASFVYGAAIHRSKDLSEFRHVEAGPRYPDGGDRKLNQIWKLDCSHDAYYAGVDEAGLFRSTDGGESWEPLSGLNDHPSRAKWFPGNGGLCAHSLLIDDARRRIHCG
ncbi:MAG: exo-alpha-sialidase, partial [Planctomycetes bacterium]|nr:exo-alpha-sialidase [Planctomycetota bacterium]